jgi:hypothetical protein
VASLKYQSTAVTADTTASVTVTETAPFKTDMRIPPGHSAHCWSHNSRRADNGTGGSGELLDDDLNFAARPQLFAGFKPIEHAESLDGAVGYRHAAGQLLDRVARRHRCHYKM